MPDACLLNQCPNMPGALYSLDRLSKGTNGLLHSKINVLSGVFGVPLDGFGHVRARWNHLNLKMIMS